MGFQVSLLRLFISSLLSVHQASAQLGTIDEFAPSAEEFVAPTFAVSEVFSQRDSATTLYSANNFLKCISHHHIVPTSTQEVRDLIKLHTANDNRVKIRATRRGFHSPAGFPCPGERGSSKRAYKEANLKKKKDSDPTSITVLLHLMNRVLSVDSDHHQITVEAGMTLLDLVDAATENSMSVPVGALPVYANLTVGGVILTSAHGSGLGTVSTLGDLVLKVKWVDGKGDIITSDGATKDGSKEINALVGGLGLLGIVTEFTFQLGPTTKTVVETRNGLDDANIASELKHMLKFETPHVISFWRPDFGQYRVSMYKPVSKFDEVPASAPAFRPNAWGAILQAIPDGVASAVKDSMHAWEADSAEESPTADVINAGACEIGEAVYSLPFFRDDDGTPLENATIPTNQAILAPECGHKCVHQAHHMGLTGDDVEFTIKFSQFEDWTNDVKRIVKAELQEIQLGLDTRYGKGNVKRCLPPGAFWLRFGHGSQSLLATNAGTEDVVYVQIVTLQSVLNPGKPAKQSTIVETIEQMTLCKYKGRPHWGKNYERVFRHPLCNVRDNYPVGNVHQLLELQQQHDPQKYFEPELFQLVLEKRGPSYGEQCTLELWCYCEEDSHCPVRFGCQPSPVFPEYKICKPKPVARIHSEL